MSFYNRTNKQNISPTPAIGGVGVIKKLSQTKYRVLLGPFNDIKKIQESFDEIEKLNFENLKIIKDV